MLIEISVALIAIALIASMIFSIYFILKTKKTLESAKRDIHNVSTEAIAMMHKIDSLVSDIQSKSDSLDVVFRPLKAIGKGKRRGEPTETVSEIVEWVGVSLALFNKIKNAVKHREK